MRVVTRLLYREIALTVGFATLGFLGLFFFFDLVDDLKWVGTAPNRGYTVIDSVIFCALGIPGHLHELLPITVLIGTIFVLARMARNSEFTILRTSGLGPIATVRILLGIGLAFAVLTFCVGDYLVPQVDRMAQLHRSQSFGVISKGSTGAWLREQQGQLRSAVNIGSLEPNGNLRRVQLIRFQDNGMFAEFIVAEHAQPSARGDGWVLQQVQRNVFGTPQSTSNTAASTPMVRTQLPELMWTTDILPSMVEVALLKAERMSTIDLFRFYRHLEANDQNSQRYEIEFWRKLFYPLSCLVMVVMALPFAFLHFRNAHISTQVFIGVLVGISFFLLNNVFGFLGNLTTWSPWLSAAAPGLLYSLLSLGALAWLVLRH